MTYRQMINATLAGCLYGPLLWFFNDFFIMINHTIEKDTSGLFQNCHLAANTLFASYAYYFILKIYISLLHQEIKEYKNLPWKLGPISLIYFGFLFPSLITYPSEAICYVWFNGQSKYWLQRILFSHPVMICIVILFETIGLQENLRIIF